MQAQGMAEVIIVGAGLSGLSAAKWLSDEGVNVLVLESRDRVGGRTYTVKNNQVQYLDLGGSYVGPTQDHLLRLAKELGVTTYIVNEKEDLLFYDNGRRTMFKPTCLPTFWNPFVNMDVNNIFRLMDEMGDEIPVDAPWNAPHAHQWDTMTFKEFIDQNAWTRVGKCLAHFFLTLVVTSEMYESSLLWTLWYVKQCGGTRRVLSTTNGGQERKFVGGSQQLSDKMMERIGEKKVLLNKPVVAITQTAEGYIVQSLDGSKYQGKYVIMATPPALQMKIHYSPPLPPQRNQMIQRMPMGSAIKVIVYYKEPFWRKKNCCGTLLIEGDDTHPVTYTLDDTRPDGSYPALVGFIVADKCRRLVTKTKEERKKLVCSSYAQALDDQEALNPLHYEEHVWMAEQYSGGCYTAMCPPGVLTIFGRKLREPVGGMFFAGTETATHWSGYMEGAVQAGERAAREVLCEMGKLSKTDIWRQEPPSQEIVGKPFETSLFERWMPSVPGFMKTTIGCVIIAAVATFVCQRDVGKGCLERISKRIL